VAKTWEKVNIVLENGEKTIATAPVIISASRATDIPAFYAEWFINRLKIGYVAWKNPFNGETSHFSFKNTRIIVFWSKNPDAIIQYLPEIDRMGINYYFQFTLNDYDIENYEPYVPDKKTRIETFKKLSKIVGKERIIWRFDPMMLTDKIDISQLLKKIEFIGDELKDFTKSLVFSFADIEKYSKVQTNLKRENIQYKEWDTPLMIEFAEKLFLLNKKWNFEIGTCAEKIPLEKYAIKHNKCIDDDLMIKCFHNDKLLMDFLGYKPQPKTLNFGVEEPNTKYNNALKDKGQREFCGCIFSKDIGQYNTCPHGCVYCYANTSREVGLKNYKSYTVGSSNENIVKI